MSASTPDQHDAGVRLPADHPALQPSPPRGSDPNRPSAELLLWTYAHGVFPMADPDSSRKGGKIDWFCPDPRGIFPLDPPDAFHVPRNVGREVRRKRFEIRCDTAFEKVMRSCAQPRSRHNPSWINEQLIQSYTQLHRMGYGHSIEAWFESALVGGLYGVQLGGAFFGESMFTCPDLGGTNASKICLVHLVNHLRRRKFMLLDTQYWNEHLEQFGCIEIPVEEYLRRLHAAIRLPVAWGRLEAE